MQFSENKAIEPLDFHENPYQMQQATDQRAFENQTVNSALGRSVS